MEYHRGVALFFGTFPNIGDSVRNYMNSIGLHKRPEVIATILGKDDGVHALGRQARMSRRIQVDSPSKKL